MKMYGLVLQGLAAIDYTALSDSDLDTTYAEAMAKGDSQGAAGSGAEINDRLATAGSFVQSLFSQPFPKFSKIQASGVTTAGFVSSDVAKQAVQTSAANVEQGIEHFAVNLGGGLIIAGLLALMVYASAKGRR
jgi:hypothetical protein